MVYYLYNGIVKIYFICAKLIHMAYQDIGTEKVSVIQSDITSKGQDSLYTKKRK